MPASPGPKVAGWPFAVIALVSTGAVRYRVFKVIAHLREREA